MGRWHEDDDPGGEYYRPPGNHEMFCAEEGFTGKAVFRCEPTVTDHCVRILRQREIIGTGVHGRPLYSNYKTLHAWLQDAIEECADQLQYLVAMQEVLERENKDG